MRYAVMIRGYIDADDFDSAMNVMDDVSGAGVSIEYATLNGEQVWGDDIPDPETR